MISDRNYLYGLFEGLFCGWWLALLLAALVLLASACRGTTTDPSAGSTKNDALPGRIITATPPAGPGPAPLPTAEAFPSPSGPVSATRRQARSPTPPPPTPTLHREWAVLETGVDGGTVTVDLHVYAAVDVKVALAGRKPDLVGWNEATLRHVFNGVPPGTHRVVVSDVMGFSETREITVLEAQPPAPVLSPSLEYDITVDPPAPLVGDAVTITVMATLAAGVGGTPQYWLLGEFEPILNLESPHYVEFYQFGEAASWRLVASDAGTVSVAVGVNYETMFAGADGEPFHQFVKDESPTFTISVKPR